ncbi:MAG: hypothetical protein R2788_20570 [Saprospiraceae bacterium]
MNIDYKKINIDRKKIENMGVAIWMKTEKSELEELYSELYGSHSLSRNFQGLASSAFLPISYVNEEYNIDLSFLGITNDTGPDDDLVESYKDYVEWQLSELTSEAEKEALKKEAEKEIIRKTKMREYEAEHNWAEIEKCKKIINEFIEKINSNPGKFKKLLPANEYIKYYDFENDLGDYPNLITDLKKLLHFLEFAEKNGAKKFAFCYM